MTDVFNSQQLGLRRITAVVQQASDGGESMSGFTLSMVLRWWNRQRVVVERYGGGIGGTTVTALR